MTKLHSDSEPAPPPEPQLRREFAFWASSLPPTRAVAVDCHDPGSCRRSTAATGACRACLAVDFGVRAGSRRALDVIASLLCLAFADDPVVLAQLREQLAAVAAAPVALVDDPAGAFGDD